MSLDVMLNYECDGNEVEVYANNITHNLGLMAKEADIYFALWRPDEIDCKYAKDIIKVLEKGLKDMKDRPDNYKRFNSPNGWGVYEHFVTFVEDYLEACKKYPNSKISVSR